MLKPKSIRSASTKYIAELDGLRFFAIMAVLAVHYQPGDAPEWRWMSLGWIGVDLFFVISGYLITAILLNLRGKEHPYRTFYWRRTLRIFPPYYGYLLLVIAAMGVDRDFIWRDVLRASFFVSAISPHFFWIIYQRVFHHMTFMVPTRPIQTNLYAGAADGLIIVWSLSVEELFYLFWAPIVLRCRTQVLVGIAATSMVVCPILRALGHTTNCIEYFQFICRIDALMFGAIVVIALRNEWPSHMSLDRCIGMVLWIAPPLIFALVYYDGLFRGIDIRSTYSFTVFGYTLCGIFFAAVVAWGVRNAASARIWARSLRLKPLTHIGRVSYGMYLIHVYAFVLLVRIARHFDGKGWMPGIATGLLGALLTITLATLSWRFFESPILRLKNRHFPSGSPHYQPMPADAQIEA